MKAGYLFLFEPSTDDTCTFATPAAVKDSCSHTVTERQPEYSLGVPVHPVFSPENIVERIRLTKYMLLLFNNDI